MKEPKQYISHKEFGGGEAEELAIVEWKGMSTRLAKAKEGETEGVQEVVKQRRRKKAMSNAMCRHNVLRVNTGVGLERYVYEQLPDGSWPPDPWSWNALDGAQDQSSDNVAEDFFLCYKAHVNFNGNYDLAHGGHNDALKQSLKECSLLSFMILMVSAMNCYFGSMLSPPRIKMMRETVLEYMRLADPLTDSWFNFFPPSHLETNG